MVRKMIVMMLLLVLAGCVTTQIPVYLKDKTLFQHRFYADHQDVITAVKKVMTNAGWSLEKETEPQIYEVDSQKADIEEKTLLMTNVREKRRILFTRYERMNVFIYSRGGVSDLEMRYLAITDMTLFKSKTYGNEKLAKRFFDLVQNALGE